MREDWITAKLGDVSDFQGGSQPPKSQFVDEPREGYVRLLQIRDFKNDQRAVYIPVAKKNRVCKSDDVMIGRYGASVGQIHRGKAGAYNVALIKTIPNEDLVNKDYFYLYLKSNRFQQPLMSVAARSAQAGFSKADIAPFEIPLPPLSEQKRIVAILDEAFAGIDAAIANTEKNLANAREIFESYLNDVFTKKGVGWEETRLENICSIKHGFAFKSQFFADAGEYVLLTPGSFHESGGYREQGKKTKFYVGEIPGGYILEQGDFLFAMTEQAVGLLGSSLIVPESNRFLHNQRLGLVRVSDSFEWHNDFFFHQFNTKQFRTAVQKSASGLKVRHTSPKKLGAILVSFPPNKDDQELIADSLNAALKKTSHLENIYQQKLDALNELKQSLLAKAFSGELTADSEPVLKEAAG